MYNYASDHLAQRNGSLRYCGSIPKCGMGMDMALPRRHGGVGAAIERIEAHLRPDADDVFVQ